MPTTSDKRKVRSLNRKIALVERLILRYIQGSVPSAALLLPGARDIYPSNLILRIRTETDAEKSQLEADWNVDRRFRDLLERVGYPRRSIHVVALSFISNETMAREYVKNGWRSFY